MAKRAHLRMRDDLSEVARMNDWLAERFAEHAVPATAAYDLKLCLNEAVANVISYAFESDGDNRLDLDLAIEADAMVATLSDRGIKFDPLGKPPAPMPRNADEVSLGGWGIDLIRENADEVRYAYKGGRNHLTIRCTYESSPA